MYKGPVDHPPPPPEVLLLFPKMITFLSFATVVAMVVEGRPRPNNNLAVR